MRIRRIPMVCCALALAACGNDGTYFATTDLNGGTTAVTDAKVRMVVNLPDRTFHDPTQPEWKASAPRIVCAEPSPDVAQAVNEAIKAGLSVKVSNPEGDTVGVDGNFARAFSAQVAQLGERLATIQLLRDKMYRACEAYANGAVSDTGYTLMLARLDKTMTTLLAGETAAGAFGRALASIGGNASVAGPDPKAIAAQNAKVTKAADDLESAAKGYVTTPPADADAKAAATKSLEVLAAALQSELASLAALETQEARAAASGSGGGAISGKSERDGAEEIVAIHRAYLDDDGLDPLIDACIVAMDRDRSKETARAVETRAKVSEEVGKIAPNLTTLQNFLKSSGRSTKSVDTVGDAAESLVKTIGEPLPFVAFCRDQVFGGAGGGYVRARLDAKKELRNLDLAIARLRYCSNLVAAVPDDKKAAASSTCLKEAK